MGAWGGVARARQGGRSARALCELGRRWACTGTGVWCRGRPIPVSRGRGVVLGRAGGGAMASWAARWSPRQHGAARHGDSAAAPWVAMITAATWVAPVRLWCAREVSEVERSRGVQGIEEPNSKSIDLISGSSNWGRTWALPSRCSMKCVNQV